MSAEIDGRRSLSSLNVGVRGTCLGLARSEVEGFRPTTGTLTGDPGLLEIEKGVVSEPSLVSRAAANREALANEVQGKLAVEGDPQDLKTFAEDVVAGQQATGQPVIKNAEQLVTDARLEVENLAGGIKGTAAGRGAASEQLSEELQTELQRRTLEKNAKFSDNSFFLK